jgi:predicted TPR repeat methyltransferase
MNEHQDFERARSMFVEGNLAYEAGRLEQAEACFRASLQALPGRPSTVANLASTLLRLGRAAEALPALQQTLAGAPREAALWSQQGRVLAALGRDEDALASHQRALAIDASRATDHFHAAMLLAGQGRMQTALAAFDAAARTGPEHADLHYRRGQVLNALGRSDDALAAWDRALALDPTHADAWSDRGTLMNERGQAAEAVRCFERARACGGDAELMAYQIAGLSACGDAPQPPHPPRRYVERLFDQYAPQFDAHLVRELDYRAPQVLAAGLARLGRSRFRHGLDLGCGTGLCAPPLGPFVGRLDGVDVSAAMLERARALGRYDRLDQADLVEHLGTTARHHDLVVAGDVFIYVGRLEAVFEGVARVLEPGGMFCFSVEALDDAIGDCLLQPSLRYAHSAGYLRQLADAQGFEVAALEEHPLRRDERAPVRGLYAWLVGQ